MTDGDGGPGLWLRQQRLAARLTQEELADRSGLSVRTIGDLERGHRRPHPQSLRRVAGVLGLPETAANELITRYRAVWNSDPVVPQESDNGNSAGPQPAAARGEPGEAGRGPVVMPQQLPAAIAHFAGRKAELAALDQWVNEPPVTRGAAMIAAICGMAGVGKTALAIHWAHQIADRFADGQLYVNLRGYDSRLQPADAAEVVPRFLAALGVARERIPADLEGQISLYRSVLAGKRILIVADNARDAAQLRPLLPGTSGCLMLVTSRTPLTGLVAAEGACMVRLDVPTNAEAAELLRARLGAERVAEEPAAVSELITGCASLPLALAVVASRAIASGWPLAALAAELADARKRLGVLGHGDAATDVRTVFSWSYRQLSATAARVFQLLGVHPGPDISAAAAASLTGLPLSQAVTALRELAEVSLVTEYPPGRYVLHDLLRAYAADQARICLPGDERRAATHRMLDHYLHAAAAVARALDPTEDITLEPAQCGVTPEDVAAGDEPMAWFADENKVLLAVIDQADPDFTAHALRLAWTLAAFFDRAGHWHDLLTSHLAALARAERLGDLAGEARTHRHLAHAYLRLGQDSVAHEHLMRAAELSRRIGDPAGEARAYLTLSVVFAHKGECARSLSSSLRALPLAEMSGDTLLQARACNNIGYDHALLGDTQEGLSYCQRALDLYREVHCPSLEASTWDSLGHIYRDLGNHPLAVRSYHRAIDLFHQVNDRYQAAQSLIRLADAYQAAGDTQVALDTRQQALAILTDLTHPDPSSGLPGASGPETRDGWPYADPAVAELPD